MCPLLVISREAKKKGTLFQSSLKLPIYIHQHLLCQNPASVVRIPVIIVCVSDVFHLFTMYCYVETLSSRILKSNTCRKTYSSIVQTKVFYVQFHVKIQVCKNSKFIFCRKNVESGSGFNNSNNSCL